MKTFKEYLKEKVKEYFYNYRRNKSELDEPIIFCTNNSESSKHFGNFLRVFKATKNTLDLRKKSKKKEKLIDLYIKWYEEWEGIQTLGYEQVEEEINPDDIVETAGAWDNVEFINFLYDKNWFNDYDGVVTNDGAIFFEVNKKNLVKSEKIT